MVSIFRIDWTLPRYFTTGEQNGGGTINLLASDLTIIPHKGDGYLIPQTLTEERGGLSIGMHGSNGAYNSLLRKRYPTYTVQGDFLYFPEIYHIDDELQEHRNRYY